MAFLNALPGAVAEGLIWGLMAIGVYISYKILDIADLTVDGSICTGACVCAVLLALGVPDWISVVAALAAGAVTGVVTGLLHTRLGIPSILAGILTQLMLYSVNLLMASMNKPKLLLLDDPTKGVDIHSRQEIHRILRKCADDGMTVIISSSESEELLAASDRIYVFYEGAVSAVLSGANKTPEALVAAMMGMTE